MTRLSCSKQVQESSWTRARDFDRAARGKAQSGRRSRLTRADRSEVKINKESSERARIFVQIADYMTWQLWSLLNIDEIFNFCRRKSK